MEREINTYYLRHKPRIAGSVLIIVLWMVSGLVAVALYFAHEMMTEFQATDNAVAASQAEQAIEGVRTYVGFLITNATETPFEQDVEDALNHGLSIGHAQAWLIGRSRGPGRMAANSLTFGLIDEASKLNLNTATLEMLEELPRMTRELAASIIDWRDEDDELTPNGAESQYYLLEDPAYECKNAPFDTVEELRLVAGATHERLYGEDWNRNGILDPNENDGDNLPPPDNQDGILDRGIIEFVTVYARQSSGGGSGSTRVNVNEDPDEGLRELLENTFGSDRAEEIANELDEDEDYDSLLEFFSESGMTTDEFDQVASQLFLGEESNLQAVVNVNTASEMVLRCLPGIGQAEAEQLVDYRASRNEIARSAAWVTEVLEDSVLEEAREFLTGESGPYTADIAAVGRMGKGYERVRFVLDAGATNVALLYRKNLGGLGWALGSDIRQSISEQRMRRR